MIDPRVLPYTSDYGGILYYRQDSTDIGTMRDVFESKGHVPRPELIVGRTVLDLGANAGYTMVDFIRRSKVGDVYGVEPFPESAELARLNTQGGHAVVLTCAVGASDGRCSLELTDKPNAIRARADDGGDTIMLTIDTICTLLGIGEIGYLKMDIEGAEREVLQAAQHHSWPSRTQAIHVELHDWNTNEAEGRLRALGFTTETAENEHYVLGWR